MTSKRGFLLSVLALACAAGPALADADDDAVAFFRAAQLDDDRKVRTLLARGLDPNIREPERGETGLIVAMRYDANNVFNELLAHPKVRLEEPSTNGSTPLMMAAFKHNKTAVLALLLKGAQVNRPGWTALHFAAAADDLEIMDILLQNGAELDAAALGGMTPLMMAAREGAENAVKLLLDRGADARRVAGGYGIDAAEFAIRAHKPWIAKAIAAHLARR